MRELKPLPFIPMEPVLVDDPFDNRDFLFQVKWDGVRQIAEKQNDEVALWTRRGKVRTHKYPDIVEALQSVSADDCLFDGEVISFDEDGRPNFRRVLRRDLANQAKLQIPVCFVVFDCLRVNGKWLFDEPIERRQAWIERLLPGTSLLQPCTNFSEGISLFERMEALGMEGIVAKQRGSLYYPGKKLPVWQKVKCWQTLQVRVSAVKWREGRPASLIVTDMNDPSVELASVSSGLSSQDWRRVLDCLGPDRTTETTPLQSPLFLDVRFIEWTDDGHLRSPVVERIHNS